MSIMFRGWVELIEDNNEVDDKLDNEVELIIKMKIDYVL